MVVEADRAAPALAVQVAGAEPADSEEIALVLPLPEAPGAHLRLMPSEDRVGRAVLVLH